MEQDALVGVDGGAAVAQRLEVCFVRHGLSTSNESRIFSGRMDVELSQRGREELQQLKANHQYPQVQHVFSSPARRCLQTSQIVFPDHQPQPIEGLWEVSFGQAEGKPIGDYVNTPAFRAWIDQQLDSRFAPDAEVLLEASFRVRAAMSAIVYDCLENAYSSVGVVAHGQLLALLFRATLWPRDMALGLSLLPNGTGLVASLDAQGWFKHQRMDFMEFAPRGAEHARVGSTGFIRT